MKDKHHKIMSNIHTNALEKTQHHFRKTPLNKLGIEGNYLNIIKTK